MINNVIGIFGLLSIGYSFTRKKKQELLEYNMLGTSFMVIYALLKWDWVFFVLEIVILLALWKAIREGRSKK